MKRFVALFLSTVLCVALFGCAGESEKESGKSTPIDYSKVDENSTNYYVGMENGIRAVIENPSQYGLYSEEGAWEVIGSQVAYECRDNVIEYLVDNGYEALAREMCGNSAVDLYFGIEPSIEPNLFSDKNN